MDEGLDTGDVLVCRKVAISPEETSGELFDRVTAVGAEVLCETIPALEAGTLTPQPQDHTQATVAPMLSKEMAEFHLTDTAEHIHNWVRGMDPWPTAWFVTSGGKKVKVSECRVAPCNGEAPGTVLATKPLTVACGSGAVQLLRVVPEGSKPMDGTAFAAGLRLKAGDIL
jgi:methionyl-tRNA formyltransferase